MTEAELLHDCLRERAAAQRELCHRYGGKLFAVCLRYARHRLEAEDFLQDAFVKIFDRLHTFRGQGSLEGWMRRITVNVCIKHYRRHAFQKESLGLDHRPDAGYDPKVIARMSADELMDLVRALPDGYRMVFNLYAVEGYSHKEIAQELGISESTSRTQLLKARKTLQRQVEELRKVKS